jgi:hypothetical protein
VNEDLTAAAGKERSVLPSALHEQELPDFLLERIALSSHRASVEQNRERADLQVEGGCPPPGDLGRSLGRQPVHRLVEIADRPGASLSLNLVLASDVLSELVPRDFLSFIELPRALLNRFNRLDPLRQLEEPLVGLRVLDDQLVLAVDGQDDGFSRFSELFQETDGLPLEVRERIDALAEIQHGPHAAD